MNKDTTDRRSRVDGDILDEVLKENGTRTNRNGELKGLQQFQTPPDLAKSLVARLNIHPGETAYDPQCAHGHLLDAAPFSSKKFGVEIDRECTPPYHVAHGSTPKFAAIMDDVLDPDWRVDYALANPPFGLRWNGADSTEWTLSHCMAHANAGLLIGNASTIERLGLHERPGVYHYETHEAVWDGAEVTAGVIYWKHPHPAPASRWTDLASKWEKAAAILDEERSNRKWNFWLDAYGRLQTYLSTRLKLTRRIDAATARNLLALEGQTPMSLVGDFKARRVMQEMIDAGYYAVEPECLAEIERAIEDAARADTPIMPVTDFELVAYAEADGTLKCREGSVRVPKPRGSLDAATLDRIAKLKALVDDPAATSGEIENARASIRKLETEPRDCFRPGRSYKVDSACYEFKEKFKREKVHLEEESLRTYTMSHDCELRGRERKVIIRDDAGDFHEFLDRPDPNATRLRKADGRVCKVHSHPESDLWEIFDRPAVRTVAERFPEKIAYHHEVMDMLELSGGFAFKPGQRDYLARFACKDFGLPAAETGVGKTLLAIALAQIKGAQRPLVIAPQGTVRDSKNPDTGEVSTAQWIAEIERFAPWADVFVFTCGEELDAHRLEDGSLPQGFYITYYECMFRNGAREAAPKSWKSKHLYPFVGRKYRPLMLEKKGAFGEIELYDANDHDEWVQGMGECGRLHKDKPFFSKADGIKCLAKPCLAETCGKEFDMVVADEAHKACFPPSTKVMTDQGDLTIGEIVEKQIDCSVLSYNIKTQVTEWKPVLDWIRIKTKQPLVKVTHESGSFICTADHEIYTGEGKIPAASLRLGQELRALPKETGKGTQLANGSPRQDSQDSHRSGRALPQVEEVEVLGQQEDRSIECSRVVRVEVLERGDIERLTKGAGEDRVVYCLEVQENHNFFADGVLVSNCNLNAQLTDALIRLQPKYRFAFTATPIPNKASNLFSLLGWLCVPQWYRGGLCNAAFPFRREDMGRFCENFLSNERDITAEDMAAARDKSKPKPKPSPILSSPSRLLKLIKPTLAYISKPACDPDYRRPEIVDVRVPMGRQQGRLYAHFMQRGNILHKNAMTRAGIQIGVLRSICAEPWTSKYNGERAAKHHCAPCADKVRSPYNPKLQTILSLCRDVFDEGRQVVIVNARVGLTDCIATRLEQCGVAVSRIDSTVAPRQHAAEAAAFKRGDTRVMLMGIKCAQAYSFDACERLIVGSLEYSYGSFEQAKGRIDRITSRNTKIYCVLCQASIEETVFDAVATKQDSATICLHGKRVPRSFKPIDMNELLAKSLDRFNARDLIDEDEQLRQWPALRAEITNAHNGVNTTQAIA